MAIWDDYVRDADRELYEVAGFGHRVGRGIRPAVLVIDVTNNFCGTNGEPAHASGDVSAHHHGIDAASAVDATEELLTQARTRGVPIFYTVCSDYMVGGADAGRWREKNPRLVTDLLLETEAGDFSGNRIVDQLEPSPGDYVVSKTKPSAFFGTPIQSLFNNLGIDTLLICGVATSGCVRATVVDGFSYNYRVNVVEECTFDRSAQVHATNLFDMDRKYADVVSLVDAKEYMNGLERGRETKRD